MSQTFVGVAILLLPFANPDTSLLKGTWEMTADRTAYMNGYTQDHPIAGQTFLVFDGLLMTSNRADETEESSYTALAMPPKPDAPIKAGYIFKARGKVSQPSEPWRYSIAGDALTIRIKGEGGIHAPWRERDYKRVVLGRE